MTLVLHFRRNKKVAGIGTEMLFCVANSFPTHSSLLPLPSFSSMWLTFGVHSDMFGLAILLGALQQPVFSMNG